VSNLSRSRSELLEKIKVLELGSSNYLLGAERWILALVKNLDPAVFDVTVSVVQDSQDGQTGLLELASRLGIRTELIRVNGRFDPRAVGKLVRVIRSNQTDIVHTHGYKSDILGYLASRLTGAKHVCTPHGWATHMDLKLKAYVYLDRKILPQADGVAPLSLSLFHDMRRVGVPDIRNRLILNGVDLTEVQEAAPLSRRSLGLADQFVIGYVGQLIPRKRVDSLIRAFALFHKDNADSTLLILGAGEEETALKALAKSLDLGGKVRFLGFREDRLSYLKVFDLFVLPSELEGIPRCLMEAMAAQINVVASDIPGTTDLVKNGVTGLTFPVGDDNRLSRCLMRIKHNLPLARTLRVQAAKLVESQYSAQRMADEYGHLFRSLLRLNEAERRGT
jgi:glycosyltransferase involved in cell wall biosynthesis